MPGVWPVVETEAILKKKVYLVQASYRKMDRSVVKGSSMIINCTLNVPMLLPAIPDDWEKEACLENFRPVNYDTDASVIFLSTTSSDMVHAYHIGKRFKELGKRVFFGGHNDAMSVEIMKQFCDGIYYGVPDKKWVTEMLSDVIHDRIKKEYHCGINIDYPFDYSVFDKEKVDHLIVMASIGCKHRCDYCQHQVQYDGVFRLRDIDCIMEDLRAIKRKVRVAAFRDANFFNDRDHILKLCRSMIEEKIGLKWGAQCPISIGKDKEVLRAMYRAGCRTLFIGYESLYQENLKGVHKPFRVEKYLEYTRNIRKEGIYVVGYFMFGFDHDREDVFDRVYNFVRESGISLPLMNVYTPVPGTRMYEQLAAENRLKIPGAEQFVAEDIIFSIPCNRCHYIPKGLTAGQIEDGFMELYKRLTTFPETLRRSVGRNLVESFLLLKMNLDLRFERRRLVESVKKLNA